MGRVEELSQHTYNFGSENSFLRPRAPPAQLLALSNYPEVTMADGRQMRDEARSLIARDEDPSSVRKDQKAKAAAEQSETFAKIASEPILKVNIRLRKFVF